MDPREIALGPLHVSREGAAAGVEAVELRGHAEPRVEYKEVFCRKIKIKCNISRQLANLLAPRVRWRQDSEVRDCVARLIIRLFERSRRI